jgi:hypothetical protein
MNHNIWTSAGARVIALTFVLGLAACGERISNTDTGKAPKAADASPSAVVIGTAPAQPTGDPPGTTPVAAGTASDVSKSVESNSMPQPGQPNDHSNLAAKPSQKADEMAKTPAEAKTANSGPASDERK